MSKDDFFIFVLNSGLIRYRIVIFSLFTILEKNMNEKSFDRGRIYFDKYPVFIFDEKEYIASWFIENEPLYNYKQSVDIKTNSIANVKTDITTTYGRLLANQLLLVENVGDKIDYQDGNWIKDGVLNNVMKIIAKSDDIDSEQSHNFVNALQFVSALTQLCVPSASEKSLTSHPDIAKRKKQLLEKYKDQLDDPAIITLIEQELIALDKQWLKGDLAEGFYKSGKDYNVSRKRMYIMHGGEKSFLDDTKIELTKFSLEDGWDLEELPKVANSLRDGAYSRGAATALGGERVKKFQQTFQNSRVSAKDCGTTKGAEFFINKFNYHFFIGRYLMDSTIITKEYIQSKIGKKISIRSPLYCLTPKTDYCEICSGIRTDENPNMINTLTASIGSVFMLLEMKATHGKELLTADYDIDTCLS